MRKSTRQSVLSFLGETTIIVAHALWDVGELLNTYITDSQGPKGEPTNPTTCCQSAPPATDASTSQSQSPTPTGIFLDAMFRNVGL